MKTTTISAWAMALTLATGTAIVTLTADDDGVGSIHATEEPIRAPRLRISNDRGEPVTVWKADRYGVFLVGAVPSNATRMFRLNEVDSARWFARAVFSRAILVETEPVTVSPGTDLQLAIR